MTTPLPAKALEQHIIVLGKTRSGKSSAMRLLVEGLLDANRPVCIIDPKGDWWGLKSSRSGLQAGYPVLIFGGEHADVPINAHSGAHVAELIATGNRPCIIDLGGWMVGERTRFFVEFASTFFKLSKGLRWLVIDECHNFAPQGKVQDPDAGKMLHWANRLASEGLGRGINLISASQRPQKVHKDYVTSHETLIAMRVIHKLDRDAMKDWIDGCPHPERGKEVLTTLAGMKRGQAWAWSPEIEFGPVCIQFPMFKTYDSFKAPGHGEPAALIKGWASVDLDEVKSKMAAVVEEAKANDPKALKAEVSRLKAELAKKGSLTEDALVDMVAQARQLTAARMEGYQRGYAEGVTQGLKAAGDHAVDARLMIGKALECLTVADKDLNEIGVAKGIPAPKASVFPKVPSQVKPIPKTRPKYAEPMQAKPVQTTNGQLTGPQSKILGALAWWCGMGHGAPTRAQVAVKAGMKYTGGHFKTRLSELHGAGLIQYVGSECMALTDDGSKLAPEPDMGRTVVDTIRPLLSGPQLKIFNAMVSGYVAREEIAAQAAMDPNGGHFKTRLSELSTFGIVEYPDPRSAELQGWVRN